MGRAENQQDFLHNDVGYISHGNDNVLDFQDNGNVVPFTISDAFTPLYAAHRAFRDRYTHYREEQDTTGLWASVLRCYRINGVNALKDGGYLYLHGSANFDDQTGAGRHLAGFVNMGVWATGPAAASIYYANYATNFTSDRFHPSWFARTNFNPGEPNLAHAQCFRMPKP